MLRLVRFGWRCDALTCLSDINLRLLSCNPIANNRYYSTLRVLCTAKHVTTHTVYCFQPLQGSDVIPFSISAPHHDQQLREVQLKSPNERMAKPTDNQITSTSWRIVPGYPLISVVYDYNEPGQDPAHWLTFPALLIGPQAPGCHQSSVKWE